MKHTKSAKQWKEKSIDYTNEYILKDMGREILKEIWINDFNKQINRKIKINDEYSNKFIFNNMGNEIL